MKTPLIIVASFLIVGSSFAGLPTSVKGRRITEVNLIPQRVLKKSISEKFYKSLMVSPIDGWVVASGKLSGTDVFGERIVRSDLDGRFNNAALQVLRDIKMMGDYKLDSQIKTSTLLLHMLVYEIADGTMVLYFATLGDAGSDQDDYFGAAKLAVLKKDGTWTEIKTADSGKGLYVRGAGLRSNGQAALKLETFNPLRP